MCTEERCSTKRALHYSCVQKKFAGQRTQLIIIHGQLFSLLSQTQQVHSSQAAARPKATFLGQTQRGTVAFGIQRLAESLPGADRIYFIGGSEVSTPD